MISIDWISFGIGAGAALVLFVSLYIINKMFKKKPKHNLQKLKLLVYESGIKTKEVYKNMQELEEVFKDLEKL